MVGYDTCSYIYPEKFLNPLQSSVSITRHFFPSSGAPATGPPDRNVENERFSTHDADLCCFATTFAAAHITYCTLVVLLPSSSSGTSRHGLYTGGHQVIHEKVTGKRGKGEDDNKSIDGRTEATRVPSQPWPVIAKKYSFHPAGFVTAYSTYSLPHITRTLRVRRVGYESTRHPPPYQCPP
jgi:hypothetical protein